MVMGGNEVNGRMNLIEGSTNPVQNLGCLGSEMVDLGMASMMSLKEEVTKEQSRAGMTVSTTISGKWTKL